MTVSELRTLLEALPDDMPVFGRGYEDGHDMLVSAETAVLLGRRRYKSWQGSHVTVQDGEWFGLGSEAFYSTPVRALILKTS